MSYGPHHNRMILFGGIIPICLLYWVIISVNLPRRSKIYMWFGPPSLKINFRLGSDVLQNCLTNGAASSPGTFQHTLFKTTSQWPWVKVTHSKPFSKHLVSDQEFSLRTSQSPENLLGIDSVRKLVFLKACVGFFSCPEQLNRWPCPLLSCSVCYH